MSDDNVVSIDEARIRKTQAGRPTAIALLGSLTQGFKILNNLFDTIIPFFEQMDTYNSVSKTTDIINKIDIILLIPHECPIAQSLKYPHPRVLMIKYIYNSILDDFKAILDVLDNTNGWELVSSISSGLDLFLGYITNLIWTIQIYRTSSGLPTSARELFASELGNYLFLDEDVSKWLSDISSEADSIKTKLSSKIALLQIHN